MTNIRMGRLLPVAILLFLCGAPSGGLVLRKRSTLEANDENRLIEALKVIERERRRLADGYDVTGYESSPAETAWQPESQGAYTADDEPSNRLDTEFMRRLLDVADDNGSDVDSEAASNTAGQSGPDNGRDGSDTDSVTDDDTDDDTVADTDSSPKEAIVDPEELKSIFQPSEGEDDDITPEVVEKKTLPYQLGGPPASTYQQKRQPTDAVDGDDTEVTSSDESREIERLFEEAAVNDALGDIAQQEAEVRPLDDVHEEDTEQTLPDGTTEVTRQRFDEEVVPGWGNEPVLSKEWVTEREDFNSEPTVVRKRSDRWLQDGDSDDETSEKLVGDSLATPVNGDVMRYLAYEDAEIDNLAKALDLATRSQLEKTDKYIPEEIRHLRRAIEYEGTLDRLRQSNGAAVNPAADGVSSDGQGPDYEDSQMDQQFAPRQTRFAISNDVSNDVSGDVSGDKTDTSRLDDYIAVLLRGFAPKEKEEKEAVARKPSLKAWLEGGPDTAAVDPQLDTEWYLNPLLRRILEDYKDGRLRKRAQRVSQGTFGQLEDGFGDLQDVESDIAGSDQDSYAQTQLARAYQAEQAERAILSQFSDATADVCPAVIEMTDNCAVARDKGLILDDEALDLCNRHQLCYACGAAHGLTRHNCDEGYLNESNQLCGADNDNPHCATDVIKLYVIMLSKHHPVSSSSVPDMCSATCTIDYIIGVGNRI